MNRSVSRWYFEADRIENRKERDGGDDFRGYHLNFSLPLISQGHGRESCNGQVEA